MSKKPKRDIKYFANIMNRSGWHGRTNQTSDLATTSTVCEFADSYAKIYGGEISDIETVKNDPPDALAKLNGKPISIECTEVLERDKYGQFHQTIWDKNDFLEKIAERLEDKHKRYSKRDPVPFL